MRIKSPNFPVQKPFLLFHLVQYTVTFGVLSSLKKNRFIISKISSCLHIKYPLFRFSFNKTEFSWQFFKKYSYINFHEILYSGSLVAPCRQTWRDWSSLLAILQIHLKIIICTIIIYAILKNPCIVTNCNHYMVLLKILQLPYKNVNMKQKFVHVFHLRKYLQIYGWVEQTQKSHKP
jgi:hypothetical protein